MSEQRKLAQRRRRRVLRVRGKLKGIGSVPRVSIFRSLKHIYAQIIDDAASTTVASSSSSHLSDAKNGKDKVAVSKLVGLELGKIAKDKGVNKVVFDRGSYLYHGRVRAVAEGLREAGLDF